MSKLVLSYLFKTNLAEFRSAIIDDNTDKICRILDIEHDYLNRQIDSRGNTPLLLAIEYASPLTVRLLLDQGAQPDLPNRITFKTPLGFIASKEYDDYHSHEAQRALEMAKILLDHGAYIDKPSLRMYRDENDKDYIGKETPLMISVRKRNVPLTKLLIEKKANIHYIERQSQIRAIHFAITNGDETMFDLLDSAGAFNCSITTGGANTFLHWFCYKKENDEQKKLFKKLLNKGCDINALNWEQRTPLMIAAKNNMAETCRILLKSGADIDIRDSKGNQAIDLSTPGSECSKLLLQEGNTKQCLKNSPIKSNEKILWRKRIDSSPRCTLESLNIINDQMIKQCDGEEEQINGYPQLCIYPNLRKESGELEKKYERIREKFLHNAPNRRGLKNSHKQRPHSMGTEAIPST